MGYDPVSGTEDLDHVERRTVNLQYFLGGTNIISFITALSCFSICIWIRFDLDFSEWMFEIGWFTYWNCVYVVMVSMLLIAANSALCCYGSYVESTAVLSVSMVLRFLVWLVTLTGAVLICLYGVEESKYLTDELNDVFMGLIYNWDNDERAARVMKMIQEYVGCCGASGNRDDYINARKPVPMECRHPVTGNNYGWGCNQQLAKWLEPWTATLAGISAIFLVTDVFVIFITNKLRQNLNILK